MNLVPNIVGSKLKFIDPINGAIKKTAELPTNANYSGPIVSGNLVTVGIHYNNGTNKSRTYNIISGNLVREVSM